MPRNARLSPEFQALTVRARTALPCPLGRWTCPFVGIASTQHPRVLARGILIQNHGGGRSTSYRLADPENVTVQARPMGHKHSRLDGVGQSYAFRFIAT